MKKTIPILKASLQAHPRRVLIVAAVLHLAVSISIFAIGRTQLMPSQFDRNGVGQFASDGLFYQEDIVTLTDKLKKQGPVVWLQSVAALHVKFYSLSHFLFSHWMGPSVLTIEPLNLAYYLAILWLAYKLAETVFDRRAGILTMAVIALWPSFLMHTTQLGRDPLLIVAILTFVLIITKWLTKSPSFLWSLIAVVPAVLAVLTIWIVRLAMWDAVQAIMFMGFVLLIIRHFRERRLFGSALLNAVILSIAIAIIPQSQTIKSQQRREADVGRPLVAERVAQLTVWQRISKRREGFANLQKNGSSSAASNVDNEVQFNSMADLIRYLPRAAALGFFAPFPNMWFAKGAQVGRTGRLLSGFETLITYGLEILALVGLWRVRKNLAAWLLAITVVSGLIALGLIVLNIGSLYRFRYPFLMLIVVLATGGITHSLPSGANHQRSVSV
jgi:hypothetical protein